MGNEIWFLGIGVVGGCVAMSGAALFEGEVMLGERVSCWLGNWDSSEAEAF